MTDKIINFYDKLGLIKNSNLPKTWKKHHIYNNSMILCLGGTPHPIQHPPSSRTPAPA